MADNQLSVPIEERPETLILAQTVELWNAINALPEIHPDHLAEFRRDIHDIQNRLLARTVTITLCYKNKG